MKFKQYNKLTPYIKRHMLTLIPFLTVSKTLNILIALFEMKTRRTKVFSRPFVLRIDPCTLCNLKCVSCNTHKVQTSEKRMMSYDDFVVIVNKVKKYCIRCSLYDLGEPFLNKDIYKMIYFLSSNGISSLVSTNFTLFKKGDLAELFNSRLTLLEPCMDGFTQENYVKYRVGGNIEEIKENIKNVMEYKLKNNLKYPIVDVQVIEFEHLKEELPLIDNFLKSIKVDRITYRKEHLGFNSVYRKDAPNSATCFWLYLGALIRPDGKVYPCGRNFDHFSYGNIFEQDIDEIWNNKYYQFSRSLFKKGPDLAYSEDMKDIPCLSCRRFIKQRKIYAIQQR